MNIELSETRKHQIRESFCYASVNFTILMTSLNSKLLELLKDNKSDVNINNTDSDDLGLGEKDVFDKLIVMEDVSSLADRSNEFCSFLTVSRKYRYSLFFIFFTLFFHN